MLFAQNVFHAKCFSRKIPKLLSQNSFSHRTKLGRHLFVATPVAPIGGGNAESLIQIEERQSSTGSKALEYPSRIDSEPSPSLIIT